MSIEETFKGAIENNFIDLQALIMFLVFEKQVLKMSDASTALELYYKEKHRIRMNKELTAYKKKMKMKYGLYAYQIESNDGIYYISAHSEAQAAHIAIQNKVFVREIKTIDESQLMTFNGTNITLKSIMDIPKILGGHEHVK